MRKLYETDRFFLRSFTFQDIKGHYLSWFKDPEVTRYTSHGTQGYTEYQASEFLRKARNARDIVWAIIVKRGSWEKSKTRENPRAHIGNIALQNINRTNHTAEFAGIIGEKAYWKKGIGTEAIRFLFDHGFHTLNLNRIWLGTTVSNYGMKKIAEKFGMKKEGCLRQHVFLDLEFVDVIQYGILKDEWIGQNKGIKLK